jgi:hypothetical protein
VGKTRSDVARQVLISLILVRPTQFMMGGAAFRFTQTDGRLEPAGTGRLLIEEATWVLAGAMTGGAGPADVEQWRERARQLSRYYRAHLWSVDRLAVALNAFWAAMCTPYLDQAYTSLTTVVEAVVSTDVAELTHTVAERLALLLRSDGPARHGLYREFRNLYKIRSDLVHGREKHYPKGTTLNWGKLSVSAKSAVVPADSVKLLGRIAVELIRAVLDRPHLLEIIRRDGGPETTGKHLQEYYLSLAFGRRSDVDLR